MRGQNRAREPGHGVPVVSETNVAGVAGDERAAGSILEFAHVLAHGRLAQTELDTGIGEAAGVRDG